MFMYKSEIKSLILKFITILIIIGLQFHEVLPHKMTKLKLRYCYHLLKSNDDKRIFVPVLDHGCHAD